MADLQSLRILTQISGGKCTNFGIVALTHLSVDKSVFNLAGLGFPGKLLWVSDIDIDSMKFSRQRSEHEESQ